MTKKYYTNYTKNKKKYINYKDLLPKDIINSNYSYLINKYFINLLF